MTQPLALQDPQVRTIGVLLVCNERVIRAALRALIDGQDGMTVVGEVDRLDAAIDAIASGRPDVTILDPDNYKGNGIADVLRAGVTKTRIVLLTGSPNATPISEALENGAVGLVLKQQPPEVLIKAITKVYAGEIWLDRTATARLIAELSTTPAVEPADPDAARVALLTKRERQVVMLVGEGLRNSQIADRLCITEVTVRNHLTSTFRKLEVANRFQLVIYAFQHGLASLPSRVNAPATMPTGRVLGYQKKTS